MKFALDTALIEMLKRDRLIDFDVSDLDNDSVVFSKITFFPDFFNQIPTTIWSTAV
jgi:hypothetical protein